MKTAIKRCPKCHWDERLCTGHAPDLSPMLAYIVALASIAVFALALVAMPMLRLLSTLAYVLGGV